MNLITNLAMFEKQVNVNQGAKLNGCAKNSLTSSR
jgi:hypothetical protein